MSVDNETNTINELALNQLVITLKECILMKDIILKIVQIIAEYGLGCIEICECKQEEMLILPSMAIEFNRLNCTDCDIGSCSTMQCEVCVIQRNSWIYDQYLSSESHPIASCRYCQDGLPKCPQCRFICKECTEECCIKKHLHSICSKCKAEHCTECKMDLFICTNCNQQVCSLERSISCYFLGQLQWIECGDLYDVCRTCFSSAIANIYPSQRCYKSCTKIQRILHKCLIDNLDNSVIELIAVFANECQGANCLECKWLLSS